MEDKLQDEFMEFWDSKKDILGLGNYSDAVLKFWVDKIPNSQLIAKQIEEMIESTVKLQVENEREKIKKYLQVQCLDYCEQQNGLDHCKNCGLSIELIDEMK